MKQQPVSEKDIQPHSAWQSIVLHLLPGVLLLVFFVMTIPVMEKLGLPPRFSSLLGILFILIPFELGVLFYEGIETKWKVISRRNRDIIENESLYGNISFGFPYFSFGP